MDTPIDVFPRCFASVLVFILFCVFGVVCLCVYLCTICMQCPLEVEKDVGSLGQVTDGCEQPSGCWGLKPSPLEEQPVLCSHPTGVAQLFLGDF